MKHFYSFFFQPFASLRLFELVLSLSFTENYRTNHLSEFTLKIGSEKYNWKLRFSLSLLRR